MLGNEPLIIEQYVTTGEVKIVFSPVLAHAEPSDDAHMAAECAYDQGKFWEFKHTLFANQGRFWRDGVRAVAKELAREEGMDGAAFDECLDSNRHLATIKAQDEIRLARGIFGQPVFDINGFVTFGNQPYNNFRVAIDVALAEAGQ